MTDFFGARAPATELPQCAGVGFKAQHVEAVFGDRNGVAWFEVHPENYMVAGGPRPALLERLRARFPLSLHGVGLSLGGGDPDSDHLRALRVLVDRYEPAQVSEHIAWSTHDGLYLADLLPTPMNAASLAGLIDAIGRTQDALGRTILIENPSSCLALPASDMDEVAFITEAARRSGCGLLLDVNNVHVSAANLGFDAAAYIDAVPGDLVGEIHLAGHSRDAGGEALLIDDHAGMVAEPVWRLYARLIARIGPRPTLIEWDNDIPDWPTLKAEAAYADRLADHVLETERQAS